MSLSQAVFRQFPTLSAAQAYCDAQTVLAALPPAGVTQDWSQPVQLADGTYVAQAFSDPGAEPWRTDWVLPSVTD